MSEQNPYAPVATPGMVPPPAPGMIPTQGFVPAPPNGFAPAPTQAFPPAPVQSYDHPGMTLTELSFAPIPSEAPPAPVEPPPPAAPALVANVLPSGGVARSLSLGGRTPLIALVLVLLLGGAGVFFGTGLFKADEEPEAPIVRAKRPAASAAPAPASPSAAAPAAKPKPAVKPFVGKPLAVNKANSGTQGAAYTVTVPNGWQSQLGMKQPSSNVDVMIGHPTAGQIFMVLTRKQDEPGPLTAANIENAKTMALAAYPEAEILPGEVQARVAGVAASGFDASATAEGEAVSMRVVMFARGGVGYTMMWAAPTHAFAKSTTTFDQFLATVKFAK